MKIAAWLTYEDKFKSANNLDDVVLASTNYVNEDLRHIRNDNFKEFARGNVLLKIGENDYNAKIIIGFTTGGNMVLYDVVDFTPDKFAIKKVDTTFAAQSHQNDVESSSNVSTNTNIQQSIPDVNNKYMQNSENNSNNREKYSIPETEEFSNLTDQLQKGEISRESYDSKISELWNKAIDDNGTIKKGELSKVDISVPVSTDGKTKVSQFTRTVMETGYLTDEMLQDVKTEVIKGAQSYKPISNEKALAYAERAVKSGNGDKLWQKIVNGESGVTKEGIAVGERLLKMEADAGNTARTMELIAELSEVGTRSGQAVQASRNKDKRRSRIIVKYICNLQKRRGKRGCSNRQINRDALESFVLEKLADRLFDISIAPKIASYYNGFKEENENIYMDAQKALQDELIQCQKDIDTLVDLILKSPSDVFLERIEKLEVKRDEIRKKITDHELQKCSSKVETYEVAQAMEYAKALLVTNNLPNMQKLVSMFVDRIIIYPDKILIKFNFAPQKCGLLRKKGKINLGATNVAPRNGQTVRKVKYVE